MNVVVTIEKINDVQQFSSRKSGEVFKKYSFVGKTNGQYPKTICFTCTGDDAWNRLNVKVGNSYDVFFDVHSREWNGKWFTEVTAWKASDVAGIQQTVQEQAQIQASSTPQVQVEDVLPF